MATFYRSFLTCYSSDYVCIGVAPEENRMELGMRAAAVSIALATLAACGGGGGGGGGSPSAIEVPFTSFAAIRPSQTVVMDGTAVTASGNQTVAPNGDFTVTSANLNPVGSATVRLSYDGSPTPALRHITISTPSSPSVTFDRDTPGHSISCGGGACVAENLAGTASAIDPFAVGWNYQTFGVWTTNTSPTSWAAGAVSVGAATSGSALPMTGNAVFNGGAAGVYVDSGGTAFATGAAMSAIVDFSARNIQFSTSGTTLINANTSAQTNDNGLNLSGTLSYAQGVNSFSGGVQTANGALSGQGSGRFYGPSAQELGGVYSLTGAGVSRMIGGFGGKQ
jgi:hypothetical protein